MDVQGFDSELRTYYNEVKSEIKRDHSKYLSKHPELREILNDFLSTVMLEKPSDIYQYAQQYFSYYNIDKDKVLQKPLVISGPSGSGKGTIVSEIIKRYPDLFETSISYTTRKPLLNETHGEQYFFVSREEFVNEISKNSFCEYSEYQGEYYGTHKGKLESVISACKIVILEIDLFGAMKIQKENPDWNYIFLTAPSLEELQKRMQSKQLQLGKQSETYIKERLQIAQKELEEQKNAQFFHHVVNEDVEICTEDIITYLKFKYGDLKTNKEVPPRKN